MQTAIPAPAGGYGLLLRLALWFCPPLHSAVHHCKPHCLAQGLVQQVRKEMASITEHQGCLNLQTKSQQDVLPNNRKKMQISLVEAQIIVILIQCDGTLL